jgi:hypothetical protein
MQSWLWHGVTPAEMMDECFEFLKRIGDQFCKRSD